MHVHETPIQLTVQDLARLRAVVDLHSEGIERPAAEMLEAELDRAQVVSQEGLPPDVVSMRSRVLYEDADSRDRREAVLVYPEEADLARSRISVLAPIGTALLGLQAGQSVSWPVPGRRTRTIRVLSVIYQPEAAGDRHL